MNDLPEKSDVVKKKVKPAAKKSPARKKAPAKKTAKKVEGATEPVTIVEATPSMGFKIPPPPPGFAEKWIQSNKKGK
jgi:hypothetical protein